MEAGAGCGVASFAASWAATSWRSFLSSWFFHACVSVKVNLKFECPIQVVNVLIVRAPGNEPVGRALVSYRASPHRALELIESMRRGGCGGLLVLSH